MKKLVVGLNVELPQLFTKAKALPVIGRRGITLFGRGKTHVTSTYEHELLSTQFSNKKKSLIKLKLGQEILMLWIID
jgi:hypothetical protein